MKLLLRAQLCMLFTLTFTCSFAQKRIGVYPLSGYSIHSKSFTDLSANQSSLFNAVPGYAIDFFSNNPEFIAIDRQNSNLIFIEREMQKHEHFMDGYVVDQGKLEGLDYMLQSILQVDSYELMLRIVSVADEKVLCSSTRFLDKNIFGAKNVKEAVTSMLIEMNAQCFDVLIPVVRMTASKGKKAKEVLVAVGSDMNVRKGYRFELLKSVEEKVGSKIVLRKEVVGVGVVLKVEDENFSILEIESGEEAVLTELSKGTELVCRTKVK